MALLHYGPPVPFAVETVNWYFPLRPTGVDRGDGKHPQRTPPHARKSPLPF